MGAKTYLCFVWHQHQPFYKDLISGEYHLPWTRLHGLKDYYGMVQVLDAFPGVRQTFNLVPSMLLQVEEYVTGKASDPFLRVALKPAEALNFEERQFLLRYFFQAAPNLIRRFPRYGELYDANAASAKFDTQMLRDLQMLSQLAWFDEASFSEDAEVRAMTAKGRGFTLDDQSWMAAKQRQMLAQVIPVHADFARRGQIEISTTPFYHPILPLVCDTDIAQVSRTDTPLPPRFRYPEDARIQLERARAFMKEVFGQAPVGLWPSEGSVSDEALALAAEVGFEWAATDNGVLGRTLAQTAGIEETYRPYRWQQDSRAMSMIFRDHFLSDLIGFTYSRMDAEDAARHFLDRIRENAGHLTHRGEPALVPIILDGENAWEHYPENGRPFLRALYQMISADSSLEAVTVSDALTKLEPRALGRIFPGSWINANFDVWIGAQEDNQAWEYLLAARQVYETAVAANGHIAPENKALAFEELLIAEGSDWNWWYGPHHSSENEPEFDRLYRSHLANVYHALGLTPPDYLSRPITRFADTKRAAVHRAPSGPVDAVLDGRESSYFEWLQAGVFRPATTGGSMHAAEASPLKQVLYGYSSDGRMLNLRVDLRGAADGLRVHFELEGKAWDLERGKRVNGDVGTCWEEVLETAVSAKHAGGALLISIWRGPLPLDSVEIALNGK